MPAPSSRKVLRYDTLPTCLQVAVLDGRIPTIKDETMARCYLFETDLEETEILAWAVSIRALREVTSEV